MTETLRFDDLEVAVTRKAVKNVHLSVHPPEGRVTVVAPTDVKSAVVRAYVISKLRWIRQQQDKFRAQEREAPRQYVERETHYLWGRRYLLSVQERDEKPSVRIDHRRIT